MKKYIILLVVSLLTIIAVSYLFSYQTVLLTNTSTVAKIETNKLIASSLNMLQVLTPHRVTSTTKIYLNGKPVSLYALRQGDRVVIQYINDPYKTAVTINATR